MFYFIVSNLQHFLLICYLPLFILLTCPPTFFIGSVFLQHCLSTRSKKVTYTGNAHCSFILSSQFQFHFCQFFLHLQRKNLSVSIECNSPTAFLISFSSSFGWNSKEKAEEKIPPCPWNHDGKNISALIKRVTKKHVCFSYSTYVYFPHEHARKKWRK